jgi:ketosteroid isomerase-like protein
VEAIRHADVPTLELMLAEEFVLVGPARQLTREELIGAAGKGAYTIEEFGYDEIEIELYGDTAMLSSRYHQTARFGERDVSRVYFVTDIWVRRDARWQLVRRHATLADD